MKFENISLLDPTTKLPLSGSLDYPSLNNNPPRTGKCAVHSREGIAPSLHIISNLKCRSGDLAHASKMFSLMLQLQINKTKQKGERERERSMQ